MYKWKKYMKIEFEVEVRACIHTGVMMLLYLLGKFVIGQDHISFWQAMQMALTAYGVSWIQRLLFIKEKPYTGKDFRIRAFCWYAVPCLLTLAGGTGFGWFKLLPLGFVLYFYGVMFAYYIGVWFFIQYFYKEDTEHLNALLKDYKQGFRRDEDESD